MNAPEQRVGRSWHRAAVALAIALAVSGCSSLLHEGKRAKLPDPPKQAEAVPGAQREHQRILAAYGGAYDDPRLQALLSKVVDRLVASSERPDLRYKVTILNSPSVNAFALPTGQLYVTRGLVALANDGSELASVLAHEMAHVIARHAAIREDEARKAALVNSVINDVLTDPQTGALALAKSKLAMASFSRAQEFEADGIGVGIAARAGFDAYGATRFLTSMGRNAGLRAGAADARSLDFLSSHPATPERIRNAQNNARQYSGAGGGEREKQTYLAGLEGLVYGEDPSEGYVRGRRFLHPKLGFTFMAPEGFTLENTAQAVLGARDGGDQAMRLDVVRVPVEQTLAEYLNSGWIDNIDKASMEEIIINGFPAAAATAKGDQWAFHLYVVRFGSEIYRFIYATRTRSAESDRAFRDSVNSFRRLSLQEISAAKPLRLRVVTVQAGDTVEKLAGQMALIDRQAERFRVLNGLGQGEQPKPSDQVKIVVE